MRIPIYVPLIAAAAVIGAGIYAESVHQQKEAAVATAPTVTPMKATDLTKKSLQTANRAALNPRSKMKPVKPEPSLARAFTLPEGRLVKLTGVVNAANAQSLVVERNGKPVTVRLNGKNEWSADSSDRAAIGKTVTVYGRVSDAKSSKPVVDADAVYVPRTRTLLYSNGQNQSVSDGAMTRVRFTASYQNL